MRNFLKIEPDLRQRAVGSHMYGGMTMQPLVGTAAAVTLAGFIYETSEI